MNKYIYLFLITFKLNAQFKGEYGYGSLIIENKTNDSFFVQNKGYWSLYFDTTAYKVYPNKKIIYKKVRAYPINSTGTKFYLTPFDSFVINGENFRNEYFIGSSYILKNKNTVITITKSGDIAKVFISNPLNLKKR
jgi:hypothetical protein